MRLVIVLSTMATAAHALLSHRTLVSTYTKCTAAQTKLFIDNLSAASGGCMVSTSYVWDGAADPTDTQRAAMCQCTVTPFSVPKCYWTKLGQYDIDTSVHFGFVYNCMLISGKTTPKVTATETAALVTPLLTPTPTSAPPAPSTATPMPTTVVKTQETASPVTASPATASPATASPATASSEASSDTSPDCTVKQLNAFTGALNTASGGCTTNSSYNWGGSLNPTETQYKEICKCAAVTAFTIPACFIQKGQTKVSLLEHYNWVTSVQCPTFSPSSTGTIARVRSGATAVLTLVCGLLFL